MRSNDATAPKTLADLGISKDQSSKWQQLADVPDDQFEAALAAPDKPTTTGIIAKAKPAPAVKLMDVSDFALSATAQQKLEASINAYRHKLEREFESRVLEECNKRVEEMCLPAYLEQLAKIERMFSYPRNAVMTKSEYNTILRCVHPDGLNSRTEEQLAEGFRMLTHYKPKMVADEEERKRVLSNLPRTREELLARKKKRPARTNGSGSATIASR